MMGRPHFSAVPPPSEPRNDLIFPLPSPLETASLSNCLALVDIMELIDFTARCYDRQQLKVLFLSDLFAFQKDSIWAQMISLRLPNL